MRYRLKKLLYRLNNAAVILEFLAHGGRAREGATILCYHRIAEDLPPYSGYDPYSVTRATFQRQLTALTKLQASVLTGTEMREIVAGSKPARGILVTFDDGYANTLWAAEQLNLAGLPAIFFIPTAHLGSRGFPFCSFDSWYRKQPRARAEVYLPMRKEDLGRLLELGMDVQSHGHSHRRFGELSPVEIQEELSQSWGILQKLGQPLYALAYPYGSSILGDFTRESEQTLAQVGLSFALSTDAGCNDAAWIRSQPFRLRRIPVEDADKGILFVAKASGYTGFLPILKAVAHRTLAYLT